MTSAEELGYLASALVLLTFGMKTMVPMRIVAIGSNLAFIAYGLSLDLTPISVLHGILLPMNIYRLVELQRHARYLKHAAGRRPVIRIVPAVPGRATIFQGISSRSQGRSLTRDVLRSQR